MKRGFVFLSAFLLLVVLIHVEEVQAAIVSGEAIEGIGPLPDCPPGVSGRLDYTQTDKKGNKVEVWCDGGQYRMKFTPAGGAGGYVGKCPFPYGQNMPMKKVNVTINTTDNSTVVEEILQTFWVSFDAPAPGVGSNGTNRPDKMWVYDSRTKKYIRQNTLHDGGWVTGADGNLTYNITRVVADGNATEPADPPANAGDLACGREPCPPEETYVAHATYTPEYELYTPTPITSIDEYGMIKTNVYKIPYGEELVIERIEAVADQPFSFDVEMPGEKAEIVTYSLSGPSGMYINPVNGVIQWIPGSWQVGYNNVVVMIEYHGLSPHIDEFVLQVLSDYDGDGIPDKDDNCPDNYNPGQEDIDRDYIGDVCDYCPNDHYNDYDYDGICGDVDNCAEYYNPMQEDNDIDSVGNACDNCWNVVNPYQEDSNLNCYYPPYYSDPICGDACEIISDMDGDGIPDVNDNCPNVYNPDQLDSDNDGRGDACEPCWKQDLNRDNKVNFFDVAIFSGCYGSIVSSNPSCAKADFNNDGKVNFFDIGPLSKCYGQSW